jgi:sulfur relay (sulfurtransferase) complex TusBCD TusD component (DsrE family)
MKIVIMLKKGLCTDEAGRALQKADDMLTQGHTVSLFLLQEAVRFCQPRTECVNTARYQKLISKNLPVNMLTTAAELRGIDIAAADSATKDSS